MGLFDKLCSEKKIEIFPDKGEKTGGAMRKLPVNFIEEPLTAGKPTAFIDGVEESSSVESIETQKAAEKPVDSILLQDMNTQEDKPEEIHRKEEWVADFEKAIAKIKVMTIEEAEQAYAHSQLMDSFAGDYVELLKNFMHLHEHDSVDAFSEDEKKRYDSALKKIAEINDENCQFDLVVINGNTHKFKKEIPEVVQIIENADAENEKSTEVEVEFENKESFGIALELARDYRSDLLAAIKDSDSWKDMRVNYQKSFLESQTVAFLDKLLKQENIVTDDKKEFFIEGILEQLAGNEKNRN